MKRILNFAVIIMLAVAVNAQTYEAKPSESTLKWTGTKITGSHYGKINLAEGSFTLKNNKLELGKFVIDMTSITNEDLSGGMNERLVGHLKSDDFFSVDKHPKATLELTESTELKNGKATAKGKLTIKGITHPIDFEATQSGNKFTAILTLDRTLYDIRFRSGKFFSDLGDNLIHDNFTIEVDLETTKK